MEGLESMLSTKPMTRLAVICNVHYPVLWTFLSGLFLLGVLSLSASEPRFTGIDLLSPKLLVVHFDTEPNRTYIVQVSTAGVSNAGPVVWRDFFVAPAFPFANHYVVADSITNKQRVYRLLAKP